MPGVRAAAAAEHPDCREQVTQRRVLGAQLHRISLVELGCLVELGVALLRRVCAQADEPLPPHANPDDPKTAGVRDPSIQGKTEKLALRFRKNG